MTDHTERLLDYLHGRLDAKARAELEAALEATPALRAELTTIQAVQTEMAAEIAMEAPSAAEREAGWHKLSASIDAERMPLPANDNRGFSLLQVAAVAVAAVFSVQVLTFMLTPSDDGAGFVPASVSAEGPTLQIAFRQDARMDQITTLLRELDATIVDGPSAMGLVTLAFSDADSRATALAALEERTDVVDMVSQP
jgi:anti-sigma factor RsiW